MCLRIRRIKGNLNLIISKLLFASVAGEENTFSATDKPYFSGGCEVGIGDGLKFKLA